MSLYYSTDCLLVSAILVLLYMPDGPKIIVTTSTIAVSTTFTGMLST